MMSESQALRMDVGDAASLGRLRLCSGIEVCSHDDAVWLRVKAVTEELEAALRTLPGTRFHLLPDGQLTRIGQCVPGCRLPDATWSRLADWIRIETELATLAGTISGRVPLRLVRGGVASEANVLLTSLEQWRAYATGAPQVRLDRWAFAVNGDREAVIWGGPSPPIPGVRFVELGGVAVEAGWTWVPRVDQEIIAETLSLELGDLALLRGEEGWDHIRRDDFVRATRSAVRLSCEVERNV